MMNQAATSSGRYYGEQFGWTANGTRRAEYSRKRSPFPTLQDAGLKQLQLEFDLSAPVEPEIQIIVASQIIPQSPAYEMRGRGGRANSVSLNLSELIDEARAQGIDAPHSEKKRPAFLRLVVGDLSDTTKRIIGVHGSSRFQGFKRYPFGWDYGRGRPLSQRSVRVFDAFLGRLPELSKHEPSLFLTHEGNLQVGWEDLHGNVVELEFFSDRIEYYVQTLGEEGAVKLESQDWLTDKLRSTVL